MIFKGAHRRRASLSQARTAVYLIGPRPQSVANHGDDTRLVPVMEYGDGYHRSPPREAQHFDSTCCCAIQLAARMFVRFASSWRKQSRMKRVELDESVRNWTRV